MTGELISTGITYGAGRVSINDAFSGLAEFNNIILDSSGDFSGGTGGGIIYSGGTDLYDIFSNAIIAWSFGSGEQSIVQINTGFTNYSAGRYTLAIGKSNSAAGDNSFAGGFGSFATGQTSFSFGETDIASALNSAVLGGNNNSIGQPASNSTLFGGYLNNISRGSNSSIIGGSGNSLSQGATYTPHNSSILGGANNVLKASNSVILGGSGLTGESINTAYMQIADINGYLDLNPQTSMPAASIGRVFFSGGSFNRMMYYSGATLNDWVVI